MPTLSTLALRTTFSTDAEFREITSVIQDILGLGFVYVPQTGDSDFDTLTKPGVAATVAGWRVYRSDDGGAGLNNFYVKVEVGTRASSSSALGVWVSVGWGVDGSGNLTGNATGRFVMSCNSTASNVDTYASCSSEHLCLSLWSGGAATTNFMFLISIERTRSAAGDQQDEIFIFGQAQFSAAFSQVLPKDGTVPAANFTAFTTAGNGWNIVNQAYATYDGLKGVGTLSPMKGSLLMPSNNLYAGNPTDFGFTAQVYSITSYGEIHKYIATAYNGVLGSNRLLMRYE